MLYLTSDWRTSSFCSNGGSCIEIGVAHKSTFSSPNCEYSVEVEGLDTDNGYMVAVRDTKDRSIPAKLFASAQWQDFLTQLKDGLWPLVDGVETYAIGHLIFDREEWSAFLQGVDAGEFDLSESLAAL